MKKIIHDWLTEDDGQSYCLAKGMALIALIAYLGNMTYAIYHSVSPISLSDVGTGLAAVLAGSGALIAGKQATQKS